MSNHYARREQGHYISVPAERLRPGCQAGPHDCPFQVTHERQSWSDPERWFPACKMHAEAYAKMGFKTRKLK